MERDPHNADGFEHLHFGFRLQSWAAQQMQVDTGRSVIVGYDRDGETVRFYIRFYGDPEQVLDLVRGGRSRPALHLPFLQASRQALRFIFVTTRRLAFFICKRLH